MAKRSNVENKESRLSFFDVIDVINKKLDVPWSEELEEAFVPYMINRGFSNFSDTVLYANEINCFPELDKKLCYDFYFHGIPKGRRFSKWDKASKTSEDEKMLIEYYGISRDKCSTYIRTLDSVNKNWRHEIGSLLEKGGRK